MLRLLPRSTSRFSPGSLLTRSLSSSSSAPGVPPPFAVEQWSGWESGLHVLSNSDCAPLKQSTLLAMATPEQKEAWDNLELGYGEQRGATFLREAICKTYETTDPATGEELPAITPEHVNVVVPAEGIFLAATALLSPGDEVVCAMPCYQSLHQLAETRGCSVTPWMPTVASRPGQSSFMFGPDETLYHNFDVAELERLVTPDTKMVVLNFPHNPTGAMLTSAELRKVVEICAKADAYLFVDEMYKWLEHKGRETLPSACAMYPKGISLGGVSKSLGLPGIRIGWVTTRDEEAMTKMSQLKDYTTISASRPAEVLADIALSNRSQIVDNMRDLMLSNKSFLKSFVLQNSGELQWIEPEGGSFAFVRITNGSTADDYCSALAKEGGIALMPGSLFEKAGDDCVRVCMGRADMTEHVNLWQAVIDKRGEQ